MAAQSKTADLNSSIIDFKLPGIDNKLYSPSDFDTSEIVVILFICNHCPYVIAVIERLVALQEKFRNSLVQFIAINPNDTVSYPEDSFDNMKKFGSEHKINFPYLIDETQETSRLYDAQCTPDIYVYDKNRKLKYRGRIDDNWKDESKVTSHELQNAIQMILDGKEITFEQIPTIGCSIKWKQQN